MCLIAVALNVHPLFPLIVAANRDESYSRATAAAAWWADAPSVFAGRDLLARGTWLGVSRSGRLAAVTNYREPATPGSSGAAEAPASNRSRGELVGDYLAGHASLDDYAAEVEGRAERYSGFNLMLFDMFDAPRATWLGNRGAGSGTCAVVRQSLHPGVYGLSNHLLDSDWPKLRNAKNAMKAALLDGGAFEVEARLFACLGSRTIAADPELPDTGIGIERERLLSPAFIETPEYGTRASTVILIDRQHTVRVTERTWHPIEPTAHQRSAKSTRKLHERRSVFALTPR
jgi:uncharacterized protein with NRDE domain